MRPPLVCTYRTEKERELERDIVSPYNSRSSNITGGGGGVRRLFAMFLYPKLLAIESPMQPQVSRELDIWRAWFG